MQYGELMKKLYDKGLKVKMIDKYYDVEVLEAIGQTHTYIVIYKNDIKVSTYDKSRAEECAEALKQSIDETLLESAPPPQPKERKDDMGKKKQDKSEMEKQRKEIFDLLKQHKITSVEAVAMLKEMEAMR